MAFKMNRPVIKGTAPYKASIAKAKKESIVSQRRTTADASLVDAANTLGKSNISQAIDYSIDMPEIKVPDFKKEKENKVNTKEKNFNEEIDANEPFNEVEIAEVGKGQGFDAGPGTENWDNKNKVKKEKVKKEPKVKKEKEDSKISKSIQAIKDKIAAKKDKNKAKYDAEQAEKQRIKEDNARLDAEKQAKIDAEKAVELKKIAQAKEEKEVAQEKRFQENKLDLVPEQDLEKDLLQSIGEKEGDNIKVKRGMGSVSQEDIDYMNKQAQTQGDQDVYTQEEKKRLIFDQNTLTHRLPSEIAADKTNYSTNEGAPSDVSLEKPSLKDYKSSSDYNRARMKYLKALEEQNSPAQKRDDRIFANALPDGVLRKNMINSGYIPRNQK